VGTEESLNFFAQKLYNPDKAVDRREYAPQMLCFPALSGQRFVIAVEYLLL
jgi:hypothetical protein